MIPIVGDRAHRMQLDRDTDTRRIARTLMQRARDLDLRALRDYVPSAQDRYIIWQPGNNQENEVHLTTINGCTCQRFKLWGRCPHVAFVQQLADLDQLPDTETPVTAKEI